MSRSARNGLTIIEVLVVIAIVAVTIALFFPPIRRVRGAAERATCMNNLKQLMLALHSHHSMGTPSPIASTGYPDTVDGGTFPAGCLGSGAAPDERLSWMVALLPYLERDSLHQRFDVEKGFAENHPAVESKITTFLCPSTPGVATDDALTSYVAMSGIGHDAAAKSARAAGNGFMGYDRRTSMRMIKDGTSNTIALMETRLDLGPWARGGPSTLRGFDPANDLLTGDQPTFSGHPGGMSVGLADGSVRFISSLIAPKNLAAAITIAGGEQVDLD